MLICSFREEFPSQQTGHYLMPEKKKYAQMLRILFQATGMLPIKLKIGFMDADFVSSRQSTLWCALCEPDINVQEFMFGTGAMLKLMDDRELIESYTTLVFSLLPNRPELLPAMEAFQHAEIWGIQDDVDEENLIDQVQEKCPEETDRELLARKIYRHRVSMVGEWDSINKEKFSAMPYNLIPQKQAKINQVCKYFIVTLKSLCFLKSRQMTISFV